MKEHSRQRTFRYRAQPATLVLLFSMVAGMALLQGCTTSARFRIVDADTSEPIPNVGVDMVVEHYHWFLDLTTTHIPLDTLSDSNGVVEVSRLLTRNRTYVFVFRKPDYQLAVVSLPAKNLVAVYPPVDTFDFAHPLFRLKYYPYFKEREAGEIILVPLHVRSKNKPETDLNEEQRKVLAEWSFNLMAKNSIADIDRLKDSLERWDELFMHPAEPEMKPVFAILKERVRERIAALEAEAKAKAHALRFR